MSILRQRILFITILEVLFAASYWGARILIDKQYPSIVHDNRYWIMTVAPIFISVALNIASVVCYTLFSKHLLYKICFFVLATISIICGASAMLAAAIGILVPITDSPYGDLLASGWLYTSIGAMLITTPLYIMLQKMLKR